MECALVSLVKSVQKMLIKSPFLGTKNNILSTAHGSIEARYRQCSGIPSFDQFDICGFFMYHFVDLSSKFKLVSFY
jgi:hypothetical protein